MAMAAICWVNRTQRCSQEVPALYKILATMAGKTQAMAAL